MPAAEAKKNFVYLCKAVIITTAVVALLGYIDYRTGEISIDILYLLGMCLVTWFTGTFFGFLCIAEIFLAKTSADYYSQIKVGTYLYTWNSFSDIIMYAVVCVLVSRLKKALTA